MSERTQLAFVWFAGYFLKSLFDDMFENIRIHEDSIRNVRMNGGLGNSSDVNRIIYLR